MASGAHLEASYITRTMPWHFKERVQYPIVFGGQLGTVFLGKFAFGVDKIHCSQKTRSQLSSQGNPRQPVQNEANETEI